MGSVGVYDDVTAAVSDVTTQVDNGTHNAATTSVPERTIFVEIEFIHSSKDNVPCQVTLDSELSAYYSVPLRYHRVGSSTI
ncbi:hypothetical protein RRG08_032780 [Elysia crispata]|uniref:Uncharacterized protein n=1 Tax=Elysia crispata TaxID=231223 RepID=A0AAE0YNK7_9GAST|nr:hypothetical protein RRG08_032780 [Elysia crispata]